MRLTDAQIAAYAKGAGFSGSNIAIAVAVALAESGGRTDALSPPNRDGTIDHGLWQINSVHAALLASGSWSNPADNARMAYSVWKGSGWHAWTTYNTGAYLAYYARGKVAAGQAGTTATTTAATVVNAPSAKSKIKPPFTRAQVTAMTKANKMTAAQKDAAIQFIKQVQSALDEEHKGGIEVGGPTQLEVPKASDSVSHILAWYALAYNAWQNLGSGVVTLPGKKDINDALTVITDLIKFITNPDNWLRLAEFIVGGALVLFALAKVAGVNPPSVGTIAKAAAV